MKNLMLVFLCSLVLQPCVWAQQTSEGLDENMENPGYLKEPGWFKESFLDIREDIAEANDDGKRLMLYFHQDGCPYCKKLIQDNFGQKEITELTQNHFDTISINMWGDREVTDFNGDMTTEKSFARQMKIQFTPTILLLTEDASTALRINGYYAPHKFKAALNYVSEGLEKSVKFRDYFAKLQTPIATGKLHNDPTFTQAPFDFADLAKNGGKPLLVMFEQKQCLACDELHDDILKRDESKTLLEKFNVAVLDMWSSDSVRATDGRQIPIRQWAAELDILYSPGMVFFDDAGSEVFRTEGYLKAFHTQSAMDYIATNAYREQPEFQRFIEARADELRGRGIEVDIMK